MNQNSSEPSGSKNYPANNYIPKSNPNSRPKKFTKYAHVVKNKVAWDRMRRKYVVVEGKVNDTNEDGNFVVDASQIWVGGKPHFGDLRAGSGE